MGVQTLFIDKKAGGGARARILSCLLNCGCREQPWSPLRRGREGDGDTHLPRIQSHSEATSPSLQRRLQTVDVWAVYKCDRCMLWVQLSCGCICILAFISFSWLHISVSKSTLGMSASESGPAHSGRMHNFLADTNLFFLIFFGCSEAAGHKLLSFQYHYFHTTGSSQLEQY